MDELEFRGKVDAAFDRIDKALADVDPDLAECSLALGALTIVFGDGTRCILSTQPSVRQIWLALAAKGTAYHFGFDAGTGSWMDDKGRGIELFSCLRTVLREATGLELKV